jgi:O-antigen/teichoic acid export membrane protein
MSRNIFYNLLSLALSLALSFFIAPMILRSLGDVRFGVWALLAELLVYLGRMDFGVRSTVSYFISRSLALNNRDDIKRYMSSASAGLLILGSTVYLIVLVLIFVFQRQLMRNYTDKTDVVLSAAIFAGLLCFSFPLDVYASALNGSRQRYLVSRSEILARLLTSTLMVVVLIKMPSLVSLAIVQLVGQILMVIQCRRNVRKYVPGAEIDFRLASWGTVKELFHYGSRASLLDFSHMLGNRKDVAMTTAFLGPARVPTLTFSRQFMTFMMMTCRSITQAVRPNLTEHWTKGETAKFFEIYITIARYSAFVVAMIAAFLVVFGRDFISLWIGERFVTGDFRFRSDLIMLVLLAGYVSKAINSASVQALLATRHHSTYAKAILRNSIASVILAFLLVKPFGTLGLAISSTVPFLFTELIAVPRIAKQALGAPIRRHWMEGILPAFAVGLAAILAGLLSRSMAGAGSWLAIAQGAAFMGITGLALGFFYLLRPEHRDRLTGIVRNRLPGKIAA